MRPAKFVVLALVVSVLVTPDAAVLVKPAFGAAAPPAAQGAAAVEASLDLDRATLRLIQEGLRNEGFDPGVADGVFGPRTRAAISSWQASREYAETGYLDGAQAEALRALATIK